jgi:hypothetical protein
MKTDVILFAVCLVVGALAPLIVFGTDIYTMGIGEIQLHDLYFIVRPAEVALAAAGLLMVPVFLMRSLKATLRTRLSLLFLGLGGVTMILLALFGFRVLNYLHNGGISS